MVRLGDVCTFYSGTGFPNIYQGKADGKYPFYKVGDISRNVLSGNRELKICENYIDDDTVTKIKGTLLPPQTVVFAKIGEALRLNRRAITSRDCLVDNNAMGIKSDDSIIDSLYFYYFMCNVDLQNYCESTTVPSVRKTRIAEIEIPLPPLDEQRRIAAVLDKVSDLIAKRREQLDKLDELVKARFVEMFGDINLNDKGWNAQPLGALCTIVRGASPRPIEQYLGGDIPWIKIGDATDDENIYLYSTKEHIIQAGVKKSRLVKAGSLIFANCGVSLGFARIITFDGCIHDGWLAMEDIDIRLDKVFLLQALNQMTDHFRKIAPSGTQPNLNTAIMKSYMQIIPPMKLQKGFVSFVDQIDKSKLTIQRSLDKLEVLKKALMQQYFG